MREIILSITVFSLLNISSAYSQKPTLKNDNMIFNFNSDNSLKNWNIVDDDVMGGVSSSNIVVNKNGMGLFSGHVSTKNNGGFIQVRSSKEISSNNFSGIKLKVRGNPSSYYVHVRTNPLLFPWQYYSGEFSVDNNWSYVEIYFKDFKKSNFYQSSSFSSSEINSIGFVAFGKDFEAKLDIVKAELF